MLPPTDDLTGSIPMPAKNPVFQRFCPQLLVFVSICLLIGGLLGCSTPQVAGGWKQVEIVTNGMDSEWPTNPQFVDDDLNMAAYVLNDHQSLALCIKTAVKQPFLMDGLTVWIDATGGKEKILGIHVPGGSPRGPGHRPPSAAGAQPPAEKTPQTNGKKPPMAPIEPIKHVAVTYGDATGPLTMTMEEIRRTGIDIGVGQAKGRSLVYEFSIAFKAAPSLADLAPGGDGWDRYHERRG